MPLTVGSVVGSYEIRDSIATGGMGDVYRARDRRLGREVVLKLLKETALGDRHWIRRFEREAQLVSQLNHPNIVTVYDIGQSDGTSYIAMELLDGRSLRDLLTSRRLSIDRLLDIACQIASGLAAAHAAGIVHRDLKPANVMVLADGKVKILDFGLAKRQPFEGGADSSEATMTEAGMIVGTVGYMSPEQAVGEAVDFRSDQFSFGSMLYEMATGKRAFARSSKPETLSAIIRDHPEPVQTINTAVPAPLAWVIARCLSKEPSGRYASTEDLARDLSLFREHASELGVRRVGRSPARGSMRQRGWRWAAAAVALGALSMAGVFAIGRRSASLDPPTFTQLTFRRGEVGSARFGPDEQTIMYSARWEHSPVELFVHRLGSPESRPFGLRADLEAISESGELALSLNRAVEGMDSDGTLARVGMVSIGAPREVLDHVGSADWSPDGRELAIIREVNGRSRLEYPIGHVLHESAGGYLSELRVSKDGGLLAFVDHPLVHDARGRIAVVDRNGTYHALTPEFDGVAGLAWSARGSEVWFTATPAGTNQALYAVSLNGTERLLARVMGSMMLRDVAPSGRVLMTHREMKEHAVALPPDSEKERELTWLDMSLTRSISSDGRAILLLESGEGGGRGYSVFLRQTDGSPAVRLGEGDSQALSPDGKNALAFVRKQSGQSLVIYPTGAGSTRTIPLPSLDPQWADWLPDGRRILLSAGEPNHGVRLYLLDIDGGPPRPISKDGFSSFNGNISPDGKLVVVSGPDRRLYLYAIEGGEPAPIPGLTTADVPRGWNEDGRHIYVSGTIYTIPRRVDIVNVKTGRRELWRNLGPETGAVEIHVTPSGRSYAYSYVRTQSDLYLVDGLQ